MHKLTALIIAVSGLVQASDAAPFLDWNFKSGFNDLKQKRTINIYSVTNKPLNSSNYLVSLPESGDKAVKLDGKNYLRTTLRISESQSYHIKIKFDAKPAGTLISRNRPPDGLRGIECGLANDKFFVFDGTYPAAMVCDGNKKSIKSILDNNSPGLKAKIWYDIFLVFSAGNYLELTVIESTTGKVIRQQKIPCPHIKKLNPNAGEKQLSIGARRQNSKEAVMPVPAGTLISRITVWDKTLSQNEIYSELGIKKAKPEAHIPVTLHVSKQTKGKGNGSVAKPFKTIQQAFDRLRAGDTLIIHPGVYFEQPVLRNSGTEKSPIIIKADKVAFRRVIISSANPDIRQGKKSWKLEDKKLQLYSIGFDHNPARVLYSGTDIMPYPGLQYLKKFTLLDDYPGPLHGFFYSKEDRKLYVRLRGDGRYGSSDPNKHLMAVGAPNAPGYNGTHISKTAHSNLHIKVSGDANVVIDGVTFETPGACGILSTGSRVTVKNCFFDGCRFGVFGRKADNLIIENNFYHHYPAFDDMVDVIERFRNTPVAEKYPIYWWHRKGQHCNKEIMKNYETGIAGGIQNDWIIRSNIIKNAFEGLSCWGNSSSVNLQVYGNLFEKLVDNALETENHAKNMIIHDNVFKNIFEPISWQPLGGKPWPGPVFVYRNLFYNTPEISKVWPWTPGCFKLGVSGKNWRHKEMGGAPISQLKTLISKRFVMVPAPGFLVYNNTIYLPDSYLLTTPQPVTGKAARELVNFKFFNNIIVAKAMHKKTEYNGSLIEFFNNLCVTPVINSQDKQMAGDDGINITSTKGAGMRNPERYDFSLTKSSPAVGHGTMLIKTPGASKDIGAVKAQATWNMKTPGPYTRDGKPVKIEFSKVSK